MTITNDLLDPLQLCSPPEARACHRDSTTTSATRGARPTKATCSRPALGIPGGQVSDPHSAMPDDVMTTFPLSIYIRRVSMLDDVSPD
jgi:hypothetical protein